MKAFLFFTSLLLFSDYAIAENNKLRIAAIFNKPGTPYVVASVEVESDDHWFRWGQGAGFYFGNPSTGVLHRLVTKPVTMLESDVYCHTSSIFDLEVYLPGFGQKACMSVNIQLRDISENVFELHPLLGPNDRNGDIVFNYRQRSVQLNYSTSETAMWQRAFETGKLRLKTQDHFRHVERIFRNPDSGEYYVVAARRTASLMDQYTREFEIWWGPRGNLRQRPILSIHTEQTIEDLDEDVGVLAQIGHYVIEDELPVDHDAYDQLITFTFIDGGTLTVPGIADVANLPRIQVDGQYSILTELDVTTDFLRKLGFDIDKLRAEDFGLCERLFDLD